MSWFETSSLLAGGERRSFIKFNQKAYDKYVNKDYYKKFHLEDNMTEFVKIKDLIGGRIQSLSQSILTFVLVALLFTVICRIILYNLITYIGKFIQKK